MKNLSIIIPAYNEEKRNKIAETLESYYKFFYKKMRNDFEIIVVPNNCTDNTVNVVKSIVKKHKNIICHEINYFVGKGGAIIEGFKLAKGGCIGFVDADGSTQADAYYDLYKNLGSYDGIIASRWINGAKVNIKQPLLRRIASRAFNLLIRILFGINLKDTQCGAKLFKRKPLLEVLPKLVTTRWAFDVDLLFELKENGYKVKEIPTVWYDDLNSSLNVKRASIEMFLAVSRLRLIHSPFKFIVSLYDWLNKLIQK